MNNFGARTITGLSMVFLVIAALWVNPWIFASLFLLVTVLGLLEFYTLLSSETVRPWKLLGTVSGAAWFAAATWIAFTQPLFGIVVLLVSPLFFLFLPFLFEIFANRPNPVQNVAYTILGMVYIPLPLSMLMFLDSPTATRVVGVPVLLLGYFLITWVYDTGAYLFGVRFGRTRFFERISPKKSWEGTIAGAVAALLLTVALHSVTTVVAWYDWLCILVIVLVFGTLGDLVESLFKRSMNRKDSGSILPGHGGILDRFDTIFISAPFLILYLFARNLI